MDGIQPLGESGNSRKCLHFRALSRISRAPSPDLGLTYQTTGAAEPSPNAVIPSVAERSRGTSNFCGQRWCGAWHPQAPHRLRPRDVRGFSTTPRALPSRHSATARLRSK